MVKVPGFGHTGPKGTFELDLPSKKKSLFEILNDKLRKIVNKYDVYIPWYIMTSKSNDLATKKFFEDNNYFNYPKNKIVFFMQDYMPILDLDGNLLLCETYAIKEESNGNGNVYKALDKNKIISNMKNFGIEWVFICGIDNVLLEMVDPIFIGLTVDKNVKIASKTILKENPYQKECVFCLKNNKPSILNYNYITEEMSMAKDFNGNFLYRELNVLSHLFNIEALEKASKLKLPYHRAFKKNIFINDEGMKQIPEYNNSYKFETFIFDAFESFDDILLLRVKKDEFAPIKNTFGLNNPDFATKLYIKHQLNRLIYINFRKRYFMINFIHELMQETFFKYIVTLIISMTPIIELRGAIPIAVKVLHLSYFESFLISIIGNTIPIYFIIKYAGPIFKFFSKIRFFEKFLDKISKSTTKKIEKSTKLQNYTALALFLFVAIPLPGTGAWTGSLIANFLNLSVKKSFLPIFLGVITAGIIILSATAIVSGSIDILFKHV